MFSQIDSNILIIEAYNKGGDIVMERNVSVSTRGITECIALPDAERVRITFKRSGGYVVIDDVEVGVKSLEGVPCEPYVAVMTSGLPSLMIEGLDDEVEYALTVTGINGVERSRTTEMLSFIPSALMTGIDEVKRSDITVEDWFDLSGRKVSPGKLAAGVYIILQGDNSKRVMIK